MTKLVYVKECSNQRCVEHRKLVDQLRVENARLKELCRQCEQKHPTYYDYGTGQCPWCEWDKSLAEVERLKELCQKSSIKIESILESIIKMPILEGGEWGQLIKELRDAGKCSK